MEIDIIYTLLALHFIALPVHVVKLTLSLRPSVMEKGQSKVKYTFFKI